MIDFRTPPITVKVVPAEEYVYADKLEHLFETAEGGVWNLLVQRDSKDTFSQHEDGGVAIPPSITKLLSDDFFHGISWTDAQEKLKSHFAGRMDELRGNPELGKRYLAGLCYAHFIQIFKENIMAELPEIDDAEFEEYLERPELKDKLWEDLRILGVAPELVLDVNDTNVGSDEL
ncbi:hypothetical protein ACHAXT_013359 [Thalassiosira profunda]